MRQVRLLALALALLLAPLAQGHQTPMQVPVPQSAGEAWDVIEQSKGNVDQLLNANLMRDVAGQLANISIALRYLNANPEAGHVAEVRDDSARLITAEAQLLIASRQSEDPQHTTSDLWKQWEQELSQLEGLYPIEVVKSEVYICPMHPADRHLVASEKCSVCGMKLVRRHLAASAVYQKPGEPTLKVTAIGTPLIVGQRAEVKLRFSKSDGSPVLLADLLETHTKKIHLLINDQSLADYHHEHPMPTQFPGEYEFSFTPMKTGLYRVWADVVPADSGVGEYDVVDLPAQTQGETISDRDTRLEATVDGRKYQLSFPGTALPLHAGQTCIGTMTITGADGKPFTQLQPVMGAFAHLVGFSEDHKSVLHIHPAGKEPTSDADRAGPTFAFKFYAPAAGFLRLYCQVRIDRRDVFVPFNLNIAP